MISLKLETRQQKSKFWLYFAPVLALLFSVILGTITFHLLGYPAFQSLQAFFFKPFGSLYNLGELAIKSVPLILIALGLSIGFRAGVIGGEGYSRSYRSIWKKQYRLAILAGMFWAG